MTILLIFILQDISANNFSPEHIKKLKDKKDVYYSDLAHQNKGCPETSDCNELMGLKLQHWGKFLKSLKSKSNKTQSLKIKKYLKDIGLPIEYLKLSTDKRPEAYIRYNSRCRNHNPKDKSFKIIKETSFLKSSKDKSINWVKAFNATTNSQYSIPYSTQINLIANNRAIIQKETNESLFYNLTIDNKSNWSVVNLSSKTISYASAKRSSIKCPNKKHFNKNEYFQNEFCYVVWNQSQKKLNTIIQTWSCP